MMADLPKGRFEEAPPFTCCAADMSTIPIVLPICLPICLPFTVRVKRSYMKRYRAMLTCLPSRAAHAEVTQFWY